MPSNENIISIFWRHEKWRYKQKGIINSIIALLLLFLVVHGGTQIGRYLWPASISSPQLFTVLTTLLIHFLFQLLYFILFLPGYMGSPKYQPYKISANSKYPWQFKNWPQMKLRTITYLFINKGIVFPLLVFLSIYFSGTRTRFNQFPSSSEVFVQLLVVILIQDFFFFWAHKLSHDYSFLYKFHKIHHEYQTLFSLVAEYTHPIDYIIGILIPSVIPFIILGEKAHCFMLMFWQVWKIFVSSEGHCGFQFPFSPTRILPLVSGPSYHDFHHTNNAGNYAGSVLIWDTVLGTNQIYWKSIQNHQEKKEKTQ